MARRLIGTGTTNAQGIATCNTTYTGVGAGKLQIIAVSGDLESETYELIDAILRDGGITGDKNDNAFGYNTSYITVTTDNNGTEAVSSDTEGSRAYTSKNPTDNSYNWTDDLCIEFDIVSGSAGARVQLYYDNSNLITRTINELGLTNGGHLKIEYKNNIANYYVNNSATPTYTTTKELSTYNIRFFMDASGSVKYRNFIVYPI